jgi:predicted RNA-binding Zn-ribbon protein involved in translation (DUF1610 family)
LCKHDCGIIDIYGAFNNKPGSYFLGRDVDQGEKKKFTTTFQASNEFCQMINVLLRLNKEKANMSQIDEVMKEALTEGECANRSPSHGAVPYSKGYLNHHAFVCPRCAEIILSANEMIARLEEYRAGKKAKEVEKFNAVHPHARDAELLVISGRFEEAARLYEQDGLYALAGEARKRNGHFTNVQVDVNRLIDQFLSNGIGYDIKCQSCGAPIHNSKEFATTRTCPYCGVRLENEYLRGILVGLLK